MQSNTQERTTSPKSRQPSQSHTGSRETQKPIREEVTPQVGPKSVDPLTKRGAEAGSETPSEIPGDHWQNPADPTRKEGDVTPIYADERLASGEDMEEPTPSKKTLESFGADANPKNSGEVAKNDSF